MAQKLGKLYNDDGELIAEGLCELSPSDEGSLYVTMWPTAEPALFDRQRGLLTLHLEDGAAFWISDRRLRLNLSPPGGVNTSVYRMRVLEAPAPQEAAYRTLN